MFSRVERHLLAAGVVIYMTRMVGLFMLLPVLAIYAQGLPGASALTLGLALGAYGLTQGFMQIPMGWLSDRFGRRPIILAGLGLFLFGSLVAVFADTMFGLILGRALQGLGAISSTLLALVGDSTREENRSRIMAVIGISIGVSFGIAMVVGPMLGAAGGLPAIFWTIVVLCIFSLIIGWRWLPESRREATSQARLHWVDVLKNPNLWRLDLSVLLLHTMQMSMWVAVPILLVDEFNLPVARHWMVYLVAVFGSFILMAPFMQWMERRGHHRGKILAGILAVLAAQLLLKQSTILPFFVMALFVFFWGFNLLEASLPSYTSKVVEDSRRGFAMGTFSTCQFGGAFLGGLMGGWIAHHGDLHSIFAVAAVLALLWLPAAWGLKAPRSVRSLILPASEAESINVDKLLAIPGVISVQLFNEQCEMLLRLDTEKLDQAALEKRIGRPI